MDSCIQPVCMSSLIYEYFSAAMSTAQQKPSCPKMPGRKNKMDHFN